MITVLGETSFLVTDSKILSIDEIIFPKLRMTMLTGDKLIFRGPEAAKLWEDFSSYRSS